MKILFATSEMFPLIKTGGLADVSGALPLALQALGADIRVILPHYAATRMEWFEPDGKVWQPVILGQPLTIRSGLLKDSRLPIYLVDHPVFSARQGNPYMGPDGNPWHDNPDRFALFCRAVVDFAMRDDADHWRPDIIHSNDWQTGLIPALLSETQSIKNVFTIHNLAYQGVYDRATFERLGLPWSLWRPDALEYWGNMSFMKGGIIFSDYITTVSPTYAKEIQTPKFGYGLDGLLQHHANKLKGILNGIGADWDPQTDHYLPFHFNQNDLLNKYEIKELLQQQMGLPIEPRTPLLVHIGRLVEQKGIDLLIQAIEQLPNEPVQFVVLGSGEHRFEQALRQLAAQRPQQVSVRIGYDEALAHQLEAGADAFLMPSRFEPCGLNQLYSLRYGTCPIVHRVGGLADTVVHADEAHIADGTATGIVIDHLDSAAIVWAIRYFQSLYANETVFRRIQAQGMSQDFDWMASARAYHAIYLDTLQDHGDDQQNEN
ncbi:glycogen synthase GlgA [Halothiobacillus sp. DCM-1]|uniref:glycogen synthase GlgA n=1 Tax=Halothiobacillus sp. DCM-1 TaxID=3112558 RepID=UPI0032530B2B